MIRYYLILLSTICITIISGFDLYENYGMHYSSGPDPGYCGDPAAGNQTCASCHTGSPVRPIPSVYTTDIPASGYIPNTTYTISARVEEPSLTRYGFQISPQNESGQFLGELLITDQARTQLNPYNEHYINHTYDGNNFPNGAGEWTFQWIAPESGSGDVTFYGVFMLSNKNNSPSGDVVASSTLTIHESTITSVRNSTEIKSTSLNIMPNPASDQLQFTINVKESSDVVVSVIQANGKIIEYLEMGKLAAQTHKLRIPVSHLLPGLYYLQVRNNGKRTIEKFWKE